MPSPWTQRMVREQAKPADWFDAAYQGRTVPVRSKTDASTGLAVRGWYMDGQRLVRIQMDPPSADGEVVTNADMWEAIPVPGNHAPDYGHPADDEAIPTRTAIVGQTVHAWATVRAGTGLIDRLHAERADAEAAKASGLLRDDLMRVERVTLEVVR